jgi:hypothetical protein
VITRGVTVAAARRMILALAGVEEGRSYGVASFLLAGKFFARLRDDDTVLVLQLGSIDERDVLMNLDPASFFFTEHYRNYPAVLIRLDQVPRPLLADLVKVAGTELAARRRVKVKPVAKRPARAKRPRARAAKHPR